MSILNPFYKIPLGYENLFTQVEYIEFSGTQYINTAVSPSNHYTKVVYENNTYVNDAHIIGTALNALYYHFTTYSNSYYWGYNGTEGHAGTWVSGKHCLQYNYDTDYKILLDGYLLASGTAISVSSTSPLLIGSRETANFQGRYYSILITDRTSDTIIRDFVPVKNNATGMYGLLDVSMPTAVFYGNAGTGTITGGPEIKKYIRNERNKEYKIPVGYEYQYEQLTYLQSNGSGGSTGAYIDTGWKYNSSNLPIEFDIKFSYPTFTKGEVFGLLSAERSGWIYPLYCSSTAESVLSYYGLTEAQSFFSRSANVDYSVKIEANSSTFVRLVNNDTPLSTDWNSSSVDTTSNLYLFGGSYGTSVDDIGTLRTYEFKIKENGESVRDLIPARRISDCALGMLDISGNTPVFYQNVGSVLFTAGTEISRYAPLRGLRIFYSQGRYPKIVVNAPTGTTVTCTTPSGVILYATEISGTWTFDLLRPYGNYIITATNGSLLKTQTVIVNSAITYNVIITFTLYLYKQGDECTTVTGGWTLLNQSWHGAGDTNYPTDLTNSSLTRNSDNMVFLRSYKGQCECSSTNYIPATGYTKLYIDCSTQTTASETGGYASVQLGRQCQNPTAYQALTTIATAAWDGTLTFNVARATYTLNISGFEYIRPIFDIRSYRCFPKITIYNVWIE